MNKSILRISGVALLVLLALSMTAAALPQPALAAASTTATCAEKYKVKESDTKGTIATNYGIKWWQIAAANHMAPNLQLVAGSTLCIPTKEWAANVNPGTISASAAGKKLTIKMSDFNTRSVWNVRVKDASGVANPYFKVGRIIAPQNGSATGIYTLPQELQDTQRLKVCVTNASSSITICTKINHIQ